MSDTVFRAFWIALCLCLAGSAPLRATTRTVHVFVALADNASQGIVSVPDRFGDGDDPDANLYWGAMYGVRTWFTRSDRWERLAVVESPVDGVLERAIFRHVDSPTILVADAWRGRRIAGAMERFLGAAGGHGATTLTLRRPGRAPLKIASGGGADLAVYIGHNGLMDFAPRHPSHPRGAGIEVMVLACYSADFFADPLRAAGARAILLTTGLMAPEAYTLEAALEGWIAREPTERILDRAGRAYARYQDISYSAARALFAAGPCESRPAKARDVE